MPEYILSVYGQLIIEADSPKEVERQLDSLLSEVAPWLQRQFALHPREIDIASTQVLKRLKEIGEI